MKDRVDSLLSSFMEQVTARHAGESEYLQAVREVAQDVLTIEKASHAYTRARVLERLSEAERVISFSVIWEDDAGEVQINRGWRVQQSSLLGPCKGGLRWVPDLSPSVVKFLAFEQALKNALTGLPLGAGKGGADFDPSGRSAAEIARFATAFMTALARHIGPETDVPAGDIGVGEQELGLMTRVWMQHSGRWGGVLTGKPVALGGSALRAEATGYGLIYFTAAMVQAAGDTLEGKRVAVSGRGNVSRHAARKAIVQGARVITMSGRDGLWSAPDGFTHDALDWLLAAEGDAAYSPPKALGLRFEEGASPWASDCDIALPCATQNEIGLDDARALTYHGCRFLAEGANMPVTQDAAEHLSAAGVVQAPGKAANAGGVAVSGLEMQQNAGFTRWNAGRVDECLREIMCDIHDRLTSERQSCCTQRGGTDYRRAANVAGYRRLAEAMIAAGPTG